MNVRRHSRKIGQNILAVATFGRTTPAVKMTQIPADFGDVDALSSRRSTISSSFRQQSAIFVRFVFFTQNLYFLILVSNSIFLNIISLIKIVCIVTMYVIYFFNICETSGKPSFFPMTQKTHFQPFVSFFFQVSLSLYDLEIKYIY